jgi:hypothetical protein
LKLKGRTYDGSGGHWNCGIVKTHAGPNGEVKRTALKCKTWSCPICRKYRIEEIQQLVRDLIRGSILYQTISNKGKEGRYMFRPWIVIHADQTFILISAETFGGATKRAKEKFLNEVGSLLEGFSKVRVWSDPIPGKKSSFSGFYYTEIPENLSREYEKLKTDDQIYKFLKKYHNRITLYKAGKKFLKDYESRNRK